MKMQTSTEGGVGKAFGRMFAGESAFQNRYTAMDGEGLFNTVVTGPGKIILQTMPISSVANSIIKYIPTKS